MNRFIYFTFNFILLIFQQKIFRLTGQDGGESRQLHQFIKLRAILRRDRCGAKKTSRREMKVVEDKKERDLN